MRMRRALALLAVLVCGLICAVSGVPIATVPPAVATTGCTQGQGAYTGVTPWPQQSLDLAGIADHSTGAGQTVAVLASGVDAANGQFGHGQVLAGHDVLNSGAAPDTDCDGRGTVAAGLIAAHRATSTTFAGLAPDVRIDPIRYVQSTTDSDASAPADPTALAAAIDAAVADRVSVILVVVPSVRSTAALQAAVSSAVSAGIVVVAPTSAAKGGRTYPAGYPGVLGVGAVDQTGAVVSQETGPQVSLVAPGTGLVSTAPGAGVQNLWPVNLPGFAAAFAAAGVALLRSAYPQLTVTQVLDRLELTATRPQPTVRSSLSGWGALDIYAALTAELPLTAAPVSTARPAVARTIHAMPAAPGTGGPDRSAAWLALGLVAGSLCLGAAILVRRRAAPPATGQVP